MGEQEAVQTGDPLLLSIKLAADLLGVGIGTVERMVDDATLPHTKIANRRYIPSESVREYVAGIARRSA